MPTPTYTPIASITLGSSASSVTFSSIPQGYRDLVLVVMTGNDSNTSAIFRINGDSGSNYTNVRMDGNGSGGGSSAFQTLTSGRLYSTVFSDNTLTDFSVTQFMDYSATDKHKTILSRGNGLPAVEASAGRWADTSAITSIEVFGNVSSNMIAGSTLALFGIEA